MEQSNLKDNLYSIILICKVYSAIRCKQQSGDWFNFCCKLKPFLAIFNKYFHIYDHSYCCKCALYWKYRFTTKYRNLEISKRLSTTGWFALKIVRYETREEGKNQITVEFYELLQTLNLDIWIVGLLVCTIFYLHEQIQLFQNNNRNNLDLSLNNYALWHDILSLSWQWRLDWCKFYLFNLRLILQIVRVLVLTDDII